METALDSESIHESHMNECHKVIKPLTIPQYVNEYRTQSIMQNGVEKNLLTKYLIMLDLYLCIWRIVYDEKLV